MIDKLINIIEPLNKELLKIYHNDDLDIEIKDDESPVTKADLFSHSYLSEELVEIYDAPVMSEEAEIPYEIRKEWKEYWLIDPLDGTKDFIAKNGEFTINIAFIRNNIPIIGVVSVPFTNDIYYAQKGKGAYKNGKKIYNYSKRINLIGSDSNFHSSDATQNFFKSYGITKVIKAGSSIKICKLAEGEIDVYPRLNGTKEWDTAASHIIANEAGCKLIDIITKKELIYNKENSRNNFFIASRNDLEFKI